MGNVAQNITRDVTRRNRAHHQPRRENSSFSSPAWDHCWWFVLHAWHPVRLSSKPVLQHWFLSRPCASMAMGGYGIANASVVTCIGGNWFMLLEYSSLAVILTRTYHLLQWLYITPCIKEIWGNRQLRFLQKLDQRELVLGGDGRCDSPGHSTKYGSYSFVDLNTNNVLDV